MGLQLAGLDDTSVITVDGVILVPQAGTDPLEGIDLV